MRIQMLSTSAGPKGVRESGSVVEVSADEAAELVDGRYARIVDATDQAALEKAIAKKNAPEKK